MVQLVKQPTRGSNTLDLVVTNHPDSFRRVETLPGLSDHDIVFTEVNINPKKSIQKPRNIPLYRRANWENMKDDLNKLHEDIIKMKDQKSNVNAMWTHFQTKLEKSIDVNVPQKIARKKDGSPWITPDIKRLIRKRDRWYKRKKISRNSRDEAKFKELKRHTQREIRKAYWKYIDSIVSPPDNDQTNERPNCMKRFWTFIKHRRSDGRQILPLKSDGTLHFEPTEKADILNGQFQKAFSEKTQHIKWRISNTVQDDRNV